MAGSGAGVDLGTIFIEGDVADPVQAVRYGPVAAGPLGELVWTSLRDGRHGLHDSGRQKRCCVVAEWAESGTAVLSSDGEVSSVKTSQGLFVKPRFVDLR
jgi:hypothetical protein